MKTQQEATDDRADYFDNLNERSPTRPPEQPLYGALGRMAECDAQEVRELIAQRDELLAALKQIEKHLDPDGFADGKSSRYAFRWAQQAIAKCEANK